MKNVFINCVHVLQLMLVFSKFPLVLHGASFCDLFSTVCTEYIGGILMRSHHSQRPPRCHQQYSRVLAR